MAQHTILVVDDEPVILHTLGAVFENARYAVLCAATPAAALQKFHSHPVDIVVMEHESLENGKWLGPELKKLNPRVPILVLSADPNAQLATSYADALAAKPEDPRVLLEKIAALLRRDRRARAA